MGAQILSDSLLHRGVLSMKGFQGGGFPGPRALAQYGMLPCLFHLFREAGTPAPGFDAASTRKTDAGCMPNPAARVARCFGSPAREISPRAERSGAALCFSLSGEPGGWEPRARPSAELRGRQPSAAASHERARGCAAILRRRD